MCSQPASGPANQHLCQAACKPADKNGSKVIMEKGGITVGRETARKSVLRCCRMTFFRRHGPTLVHLPRYLFSTQGRCLCTHRSSQFLQTPRSAKTHT